jgi:WD40 repeat protein
LGHKKNILALNWTNTDDRWIISGGQDSIARVWDTRTGKLVVELAKHQDIIQSASFTSDDSKVVTLGIDKHLIIWEILSSEFSTEFKAHEITRIETKNFMELALSQNRLVTMNYTHIQVYNFSNDDSLVDAVHDISS